MKKLFLLPLILLCTLAATPPETSLLTEAKESNPSFTYLCVGVTGNFKDVMGFDPFIGRRQFLSSHGALDIGGGVWAFDLFYGQASYLYYPIATDGPYFGAGLTLGYSPNLEMGWANFPITCGYQFRIANRLSPFIQFQISPITTPQMGTATFSFGFGF